MLRGSHKKAVKTLLCWACLKRDAERPRSPKTAGETACPTKLQTLLNLTIPIENGVYSEPVEILAGFLIALAIGATGVGAGSITAPILILFFGMSAPSAVTTSLVFSTIVKLFATPIYLSRGHVNFRVLAYVAGGGLPAVIVG